MMWVIKGYNFKGPLHLMTKVNGHRGIDSEAYRVQILEVYLTKLQANNKRAFIIEDNAPIHDKKKNSKCKGT